MYKAGDKIIILSWTEYVSPHITECEVTEVKKYFNSNNYEISFFYPNHNAIKHVTTSKKNGRGFKNSETYFSYFETKQLAIEYIESRKESTQWEYDTSMNYWNDELKKLEEII